MPILPCAWQDVNKTISVRNQTSGGCGCHSVVENMRPWIQSPAPPLRNEIRSGLADSLPRCLSCAKCSIHTISFHPQIKRRDYYHHLSGDKQDHMAGEQPVHAGGGAWSRRKGGGCLYTWGWVCLNSVDIQRKGGKNKFAESWCREREELV